MTRRRPDRRRAAARSASGEHGPLDSLTGLRGIAAALVFVYHVRNTHYVTGPAESVLSALAGPGFTGVSLFFVLSGFVLTWSARPGDRARDVYRRRIARIVPLHLAALVLALIVAATLVPAIRTRSPVAIVANALLVSSWVPQWFQAGNPVSWSLVCEAFFYALFPLLLAATRRLERRGLLRMLGAAIMLTAVSAVLAGTVPALDRMGFFPLARVPEFAAGMALALLVRGDQIRIPDVRIALGLIVVGWIGASPLPLPSAEIAVALTIPGFVALLAALARRDLDGRTSALRSRGLVTLGVLSYAFYLVHLLVIQALGAVLGVRHDPAVAAALTLVAYGIATALAWILHRGIERPAQRGLLRAGRRSPAGVAL